jgi:DmsE family decaheme c-type cytochrome
MKRTLVALAPLLALVTWLGPPASAQTPGDTASGVSCVDCHEDVVKAMATQTHMRLEPFEVGGRTVGCEGCHGDGTKHAEAGGDAALIRRFDKEGSGDAACLECHKGRGLPEWHASTHAREEIGCSQCHSVHTASTPLDVCQRCHADVTAKLQLPYRHPLRERKMTCTSCHDTHAATEKHLLTHQRTNDLCYQCHQDKEGPFAFEHSPVEEDCLQCHDPHGSVARGLLTVGEPALCLQCHEFHFHSAYRAADGEVEVGGVPRESPLGRYSFNAGMSTRCTVCHQRVHGSDLPSQGTPSSGRGLAR